VKVINALPSMQHTSDAEGHADSADTCCVLNLKNKTGQYTGISKMPMAAAQTPPEMGVTGPFGD